MLTFPTIPWSNLEVENHVPCIAWGQLAASFPNYLRERLARSERKKKDTTPRKTTSLDGRSLQWLSISKGIQYIGAQIYRCGEIHHGHDLQFLLNQTPRGLNQLPETLWNCKELRQLDIGANPLHLSNRTWEANRFGPGDDLAFRHETQGF